MDSIMTGGSKMAPISADQSERRKPITIEAIGVCQTLVIEGSGFSFPVSEIETIILFRQRQYFSPKSYLLICFALVLASDILLIALSGRDDGVAFCYQLI